MKPTDEQKLSIAPLIESAIAAKDAAEDADRKLTRAVDRVRRSVGAPADAVFDHCRMCFCKRMPDGTLEPL